MYEIECTRSVKQLNDYTIMPKHKNCQNNSIMLLAHKRSAQTYEYVDTSTIMNILKTFRSKRQDKRVTSTSYYFECTNQYPCYYTLINEIALLCYNSDHYRWVNEWNVSYVANEAAGLK